LSGLQNVPDSLAALKSDVVSALVILNAAEADAQA
jgi:hypothetical protein